jgi:large subunit ribosomal protein L15
MRLHEITQTHARPAAKRVGRGISAGGGKTAGRGTKGQKSRTGANSNIPRTFQGAATGFIQRLPKLKGFKSHREKPVTVSLTRIAAVFEDKATISIIALIEKGLIKPKEALSGIKIVGSSQPIEKTFTFDTEDTLLITSKKLSSNT